MSRDSVTRPNIVLDPEIVARFLPFARSFANDERLTDEGLTGNDLHHLADYVERAQGSAIIARLT